MVKVLETQLNFHEMPWLKWKDETAETTLREIHWSPSRTGLINPVAVFDPVELEGTTITRASVHNVSIVESLKLGIGDTITDLQGKYDHSSDCRESDTKQ